MRRRTCLMPDREVVMNAVRALRALFVATTLLASPCVALAQNSGSRPPAGREEIVETSPVMLDGRVLFRVRGAQVFPAGVRADTISARIHALARDRSFDPAALDTSETEGWVRIGAGNRWVMRVYNEDAQAEGVDLSSLSEIYMKRVREAIVEYRAARSRAALAGAGWRGGVATLLALLVAFVLRMLYGALNRWEVRNAQRVKSVSISSFEVVGAHHIWAAVRGVLRLAFVIGSCALALLYLRYVLGLFPWTWGAAHQLSGWVVGPLVFFGRGLLAMIPDVIFLIIQFVVTRYALSLIKSFFDSVGNGSVALKSFYPEWAGPTYNLVRVGVIAFSLVLAYPHIPGASSDAFKGVSIFMGAILSLGSTGVMSNVIAGYTMVYRRAFKVGDLIKVGDVIGFVTNIRLQVTHLRTQKNEEVVVPNVNIMNSEVTNFTTLAATDGLILHTTVGIGYETSWRLVEAMLLEAADRTPGLLKEPKPFVRQRALGDFAVTYEINAFCNTPDRIILLYSQLHANILDLFNENNIQIMTPAYEGDPEKPKVVPREEWYLTPAPRPKESES
jgi:small-conductance mechanosensitive channel